jgi:transcriptional regulator with XRE-family HTH domain
MEWHTTALTHRIMMPRQTFLKKAYEFLKIRFDNGETFFDALEPTIDDLAAFFGVSRLAAKIRMIDIGYEEAIGAFNYIDGRYIKPYAFDKGSLARNQTFSIGAVDAGLLPFTDPEFSKATTFGEYLHVDAHFVLNSPRYITQDGNGATVLTDYARQHMNECCLVFYVSVKSDKQEASYVSECVLNRDKDSPFELEIKFHNGYQNSTPKKQQEYLASVVKENMEMYGKLSNDHTDCLEKVREWRGMTYVAIADEIPMEERQVRRIFKGESNGSIESLVAICLVLHLPPEISLDIINKSPLTLSLAKTEHQWYRFVLQYQYGKTIEEVRAFLQSHNVAL